LLLEFKPFEFVLAYDDPNQIPSRVCCLRHLGHLSTLKHIFLYPRFPPNKGIEEWISGGIIAKWGRMSIAAGKNCGAGLKFGKGKKGLDKK
jgi:hypothetical protein